MPTITYRFIAQGLDDIRNRLREIVEEAVEQAKAAPVVHLPDDLATYSGEAIHDRDADAALWTDTVTAVSANIDPHMLESHQHAEEMAQMVATYADAVVAARRGDVGDEQ